MELRAPAEGAAAATVVEASMGRSGPQATVIVKRGKLRVGDPVIVGTQWGKVGPNGPCACDWLGGIMILGVPTPASGVTFDPSNS